MRATMRSVLAGCAAVGLAACAPVHSVRPVSGWSDAEELCARWSDGRFYCTSAPDRRFTPPTPLEVPIALKAVSGGGWSACGLDSGGTAFCWRWLQSFEGERVVLTLVVDSLTDRTGLRFGALASSGGDWVCGIDADQAAWCTAMLPPQPQGCMEITANRACLPQPARIANGITFSQVDVGEVQYAAYGFACALAADGRVYCWHRDGVFLFTESGDPELCRVPRLKSFNCTREPRPVHTDARFTQIAVGAGYACGVTTGSALLCWGYSGPLGVLEAFRNCDYRSDFICTARPSPVVGLGNVLAVDAGDLHSCAITADRRAVCWGNGSMSQLGARSETSSSFGDAALVTVEGNHRWAQITTGPFLTCGITVGREWYCWGQQPVDRPLFTGPQRVPDPAS